MHSQWPERDGEGEWGRRRRVERTGKPLFSQSNFKLEKSNNCRVQELPSQQVISLQSCIDCFLAAHCRLPICLLDSGPRYRVNGVDKGTSLSPPHTFARKCSNSSSQSLLLLAVAWSATLKWPKIPNVTQKNKTKNKQYTMKYGVHFQHKASNISGLCESVGWSESDASKRFNSFESQIFLTLNL